MPLSEKKLAFHAGVLATSAGFLTEFAGTTALGIDLLAAGGVFFNLAVAGSKTEVPWQQRLASAGLGITSGTMIILANAMRGTEILNPPSLLDLSAIPVAVTPLVSFGTYKMLQKFGR